MTKYRRLRHKFGAVRCEVEGQKFPSKKEGAYYKKLLELQRKGEILFFLRQVPFHLPGNIIYRMDFIEFWAPKENDTAGDIIFTEVKGMITADARIKMAQTEDLYNITINVI